MTTETEKAPETPNDEEQSFLPTVLAGVGILAVAALLIFWPSDDDSKGGKASKDKANATAKAKGAAAKGGAGAGGRAAGVGKREVDAATKREGSGTRNPAIKLPAGGRGMAPMPEALPKDPPENATADDKIAFYEKRLDAALRLQESRKKFADRLPQVQARIEASPNPEQGMKTFEQRKTIVEDNYAKAKAEVETIEGKLAELRGE
jgi:hypothetical protein